MTFAQRNVGTPGTNGILTHNGITCYRCQNTGHYASDCPEDHAESTTSGTTLLQYGWILFDSQSTISVFHNPDMLTNIRPSDRTLRATTNGGFLDSNLIGDFPNLGPVWFNEASIANILSLADVRKICRVTMDITEEPAMVVHRLDGSTIKIREHECGLYVFHLHKHSSDDVAAYTLVSTVAAQKRLFTRRDIAKADVAQQLYRVIGQPSKADFHRILNNGSIRNCPVTSLEAKRALTIYRPDIAKLKGKTTWLHQAPRAPNFTAVVLPPSVLNYYRDVTLWVDFFFVQGHIFLHTISRDIFFRTVRSVPDRTRATIIKEISAVIKLYSSRGYRVCALHADNKFACARDVVQPIRIDVVAADSHVGEVERSIQTIKVRLRVCVHGLPFTRLPKILVVHLVADVVRCLNMFPAAHGISNAMSPLSLVTGAPPPDYNYLQLEFGTYVQLFQDPVPSNTLTARTLGAIAVTPTGNLHGDFHFLSLSSGLRVSRHCWTALPMTDTAITRVEALAKLEDQPITQDAVLVVEWCPDKPIDDDEYDRPYAPPARAPSDSSLEAGDYSSLDPAKLADLHADAAARDGPPLALAVPDQGAPHEAHEHSDENAYTSEDTSKDAYISEDDDVDTPAELDNDHSSYNDNDNNNDNDNDNDGPDDNSQYDGDHKDDHSDGPTTMVKALFSITSSEATTPPPTATRSSIALYSK